VDPDDMIGRFGADALRLCVMFVAPPENEVEWTDAGLEGSYRFLGRVWRLVVQWADRVRGREVPQWATLALDDAERALRQRTHATIKRVTADLDPRVHLNTSVSALMELVNALYGFTEEHTREGLAGRRRVAAAARAADERAETLAVIGESVEALVLMLAPFTPHIAEELWEELGHAGGLHAAPWPSFDAAIARASEMVVPVQVNGKVRSRLTVAADVSELELQAIALADPAVRAHTDGKTVGQVIVAKGKLVSIVAR
jgi:leucyl-tRNA synthetase